MREIQITQAEAGQRLDKLLAKYMELAPKSFFYKMLRKKNITLNDKKAEGGERLTEGDVVKLYFSEETLFKFQKEREIPVTKKEGEALSILYEDTHILVLNKPAGLLSQKARPEDISLVEKITDYLLETGELKREQLSYFRPGICNRLDRNTSGIVVAGKTLEGLQRMGELFRERAMDKYYFCIVKGYVEKRQTIEGWLKKDHSHNKVSIYKASAKAKKEADKAGAEYIKTEYEPLILGEEFTYLKVKLITGKSHQIRAHLESIGHPIIGDGKYGDVAVNKYFRKAYQLKHQLLHAGELHLPKLSGLLSPISEQVFKAPLPEYFEEILKGEF
jgi:23S rRNA pseudouridine955/2504/2580 synthase